MTLGTDMRRKRMEEAINRERCDNRRGGVEECERPRSVATEMGKLTASSRIINSNLLQKRFFPESKGYASVIIFCRRT